MRFDINPNDAAPIYRQIVEQVRRHQAMLANLIDAAAA